MDEGWEGNARARGRGLSLPEAMRLGAVRLAVTELDRSIDFYVRVVGLEVTGRVRAAGHDVARLGVGGEDVVVLQEERAARRAGRHAGLYHVALNYASRVELGRALRRILEIGTSMQGASDHRTHEAIYLADPDGNGLELAWDLPRETWPSAVEQYASGPAPLDLQALLDLTVGEPTSERAGKGLRVGHLHLHVGDIAEALAFYVGLVGFELQADIGTAAFVSAGGYHHHLAVNVWRGQGVPAVPADVVGLREWSILLPDTAAVEAVRERLVAAGATVSSADDGLDASGFTTADPWGIPLRVGVDPAPRTER